jgi:hypothetical protein
MKMPFAASALLALVGPVLAQAVPPAPFQAQAKFV